VHVDKSSEVWSATCSRKSVEHTCTELNGVSDRSMFTSVTSGPATLASDEDGAAAGPAWPAAPVLAARAIQSRIANLMHVIMVANVMLTAMGERRYTVAQ